ncbi:HNH endonuclease [Shewanella sp. Scap07]|uniref:HNH endonuclease n=1 Tax=Shewanella sp. Scap07 TaxID=2589987 RepID=UPI0015BF54B4|nr:HNH endonuclease [Shewanella sp. Scap07]QLE83763.1 HNH endonuclease [Shewanella sp. Scap07]
MIFSVSYETRDGVKRKKYKTEQGALRAIYKWFQTIQSDQVVSVVLIGPGHDPSTFECVEQVPFTPPKTTSFYHTQAWRHLRRQALIRYDKKCRDCGATANDGVRLEVDHIKPRSKYPLLELDIDNLQILCSECNKGKLDHNEAE